VRASALGALARIGVLAPFEVSAALADPAPEVRRRACDLAGRLGVIELAPQLTKALGDDVPAVTEAACYALGELQGLGEVDGPSGVGPAGVGPTGTVTAGTTLEGAQPAVVAAAVQALKATATGHPEPLCREAAVAALGSLRQAEGLPAVLAALDDKPAIRRRAVVALAGYEGPEVDAALARAAQDVDWQVRQVAEDLLGCRPRGR
jgi:HEAT repeat protein